MEYIPGKTQESAESIDFSTCETVQDLWNIIDRMEREGLTLQGTKGSYDFSAIRASLTEVRSYRAEGKEDLAQQALRRITRTAGLRAAVDKLIKGGRESWIPKQEE